MKNAQRYLAIRAIAKHSGKKPEIFEPYIKELPDRVNNVEEFDAQIDRLWVSVKKLIPKAERNRVENGNDN